MIPPGKYWIGFYDGNSRYNVAVVVSLPIIVRDASGGRLRRPPPPALGRPCHPRPSIDVAALPLVGRTQACALAGLVQSSVRLGEDRRTRELQKPGV